MKQYPTVAVNPTTDGVTDDQGYTFTNKKGGTVVLKTLRVTRKLASGELVEVLPEEPKTNKQKEA